MIEISLYSSQEIPYLLSWVILAFRVRSLILNPDLVQQNQLHPDPEPKHTHLK
jgi:hypothetical protein